MRLMPSHEPSDLSSGFRLQLRAYSSHKLAGSACVVIHGILAAFQGVEHIPSSVMEYIQVGGVKDQPELEERTSGGGRYDDSKLTMSIWFV